jgi:Zn-dependent protease with chaperone function
MPPTLQADYFDGRSARAQPVTLWLAQGQLWLRSAHGVQHYPQQAVRWPERSRHGQRQAQLPDGGVLSCADAAAWDDWALAATAGQGLGEGLALRWIRSWRRVMLALVLLIVGASAAWVWGVPRVGDALLRWVPLELDRQVGERGLAQLDEALLQPSRLSVGEQAHWRERFAQLLSQGQPARVEYRLQFRQGGPRMGANALALPGGTMVLTDELVTLLADQPDALLGVLAHELGHLEQRHGMRALARAMTGSALAGMMMGDFSGLMAAAPALLMQQHYSRGFERDADQSARERLRAAGRSPAVMVTLFQRLARQEGVDEGALRLAFSSHPAPAERIRFFSD